MGKKPLNLFEKLGFFIINHFWKFAFFCLVGFCAFLIDWGFFNIIYRISALFVLSRVTSALISMIFNFNVNRNITFSAGGYPIKKQVSRWLIVYFVALLVNVSVGKIVLTILGENLLNANIAYFCGIALAIPISFLGSLLWVFKKN